MDSQFEVVNDLLYYVDKHSPTKLRLYVPERMREQLLWENHCVPIGGHMGAEKVLERVARKFYWPRMRQDVIFFCKSCIICAARAGQGRQCKPPLQPIPPPSAPWETVAMDIVGFSRANRTIHGNEYCLVLTCLFSKWLIAIPMPNQEAETVVHALVDNMLPHEGMPQHILTDQGVQFTSELMRVTCEIFQVDHLFTTTYHPQCDGQTERANRSLINMLSKCCALRPHDWDQLVPLIVCGYNATQHSSTKDSPYHLMYFRQPRLPSGHLLESLPSPFTVDFEQMKDTLPEDVKLAWQLVREELLDSKTRQKEQYDKTAKVPEFQVGDKVLVEDRGVRRKLRLRFKGPFEIVRLTPTNAVVLVDPHSPKGTRKVHLDKLSKADPALEDRVYTGDRRRRLSPPTLPKRDSADKSEGPVPDDSPTPEVDSFSDQRRRKRNRKQKTNSDCSSQHSYNLRPRGKRVRRIRLVRAFRVSRVSVSAVGLHKNMFPFSMSRFAGAFRF